MYAVINSGGKQYRVMEGQTVELEKLPQEIGEAIEFDNVLLIGKGEKVQVGAPTLENAKVVGEIVQHGRGKKVSIIKFRRRKHSMKRMGHRQSFTAVKITKISE